MKNIILDRKNGISILTATLDFEAYKQSLCTKSADSSEALAAMMEKRKPLFSGR